MRKLAGVLFVGLVAGQLWLTGCGGDEPIPQAPDRMTVDTDSIETYLERNALTATQHESGIFYYPVTENPTGNTQQTNGSILSIYYTAKVMDGVVIDEVLASQGEDPYRLKQGVNSIVPVGLDTGLSLMREGEKYVFLIPSPLAYGELTFSTLIPAHAIIEIEVELVKIENESDVAANEEMLIDQYIIDNELNDRDKNPKDSVKLLPTGVYYKRVTEAAALQKPFDGEEISVTYTAEYLDGTVFDRVTGNDTFDFAFNIAAVFSGLDLGLAAMDHGEKALLIIPSAHGYQQSVGIVPSFLADKLVELKVIPEYATKVSPYQVLVFDITLL